MLITASNNLMILVGPFGKEPLTSCRYCSDNVEPGLVFQTAPLGLVSASFYRPLPVLGLMKITVDVCS